MTGLDGDRQHCFSSGLLLVNLYKHVLVQLPGILPGNLGGGHEELDGSQHE